MILTLWLALWTIGWFLFWPWRGRASWAAPRGVLPRLSLVIPARNEERNLAKLLGSLGPPGEGVEICVVDDESTDKTQAVARSFGARVIVSQLLPTDWIGKNWACFQGARAASHAHLIFMDADVEVAPGGLDRIRALWQGHHPDEVLSILPYHRIEAIYENLSAYFQVFMALGTGAFSLLPRFFGPDKLVGQCLCVSRAAYEGVGGHEAVKGKILENFYLSRLWAEQGIVTRSFSDRRLLSFRMFPDGLASLVEGWSKAFAQGSHESHPALLALSVLWLVGALAVFPAGFFWSPLASLVMYAVFAAQAGVFFRRLGNFSVVGAFFYPVLALGYLIIFFRSLKISRGHGQARWRGRVVKSPPK